MREGGRGWGESASFARALPNGRARYEVAVGWLVPDENSDRIVACERGTQERRGPRRGLLAIGGATRSESAG